MSLDARTLQSLRAAAIDAARTAGRMIARSRPQHIEHKDAELGPASQVLTEVDRRSEAIILELLEPTLARHDLGLLSEEREDTGDRLRAHAWWCIDPLDGTLAFIEDRPGYTVSIALVTREGEPLVGVVYDPVHDQLVHAARGLGLFLDEQPWDPQALPRGEVLSVFVDRSFHTMPQRERALAVLREHAEATGLGPPQVIEGGGAVMNAWRVLATPPACYFKLPKPGKGGGSLWDFAATACLFHEAGAIATDIHGEPLDLNRRDSTFMNHRGVLYCTDSRLCTRLHGLAPG